MRLEFAIGKSIFARCNVQTRHYIKFVPLYRGGVRAVSTLVREGVYFKFNNTAYLCSPFSPSSDTSAQIKRISFMRQSAGYYLRISRDTREKKKRRREEEKNRVYAQVSILILINGLVAGTSFNLEDRGSRRKSPKSNRARRSHDTLNA